MLAQGEFNDASIVSVLLFHCLQPDELGSFQWLLEKEFEIKKISYSWLFFPEKFFIDFRT